VFSSILFVDDEPEVLAGRVGDRPRGRRGRGPAALVERVLARLPAIVPCDAAAALLAPEGAATLHVRPVAMLTPAALEALRQGAERRRLERAIESLADPRSAAYMNPIRRVEASTRPTSSSTRITRHAHRNARASRSGSSDRRTRSAVLFVPSASARRCAWGPLSLSA
jgi:hypothetical protein